MFLDTIKTALCERFALRALACFVLGGLSSLAMAPLNLFPALFVGLSALYVFSAYEEKPLRASLYGYLFGLGYFLFSLSWIGNALLVEGNDYIWAWPFAIIGLPAILSIYPALAVLVARALSNLKTLSGYLLFALSLFAFEWLRGHLLTGFPWNLYGYTWADILSIAQTASLFGGIYLLTLLTIFWVSLPGFLYVSMYNNRRKTLIGSFVALTFIGLFSYGTWRLSHNPVTLRDDVAVRLVQPNIGQAEKWDRRKMVDHFYTLVNWSYAHRDDFDVPTYIIWPETALSEWFINDRSSMDALKDALQSYSEEAYLLAGVLHQRKDDKSFRNSIMLFDQNAEITQTYDKSHLVPFGEYIPLQSHIPLEPVIKFTGLTPGNGRETQTGPSGLTYSPLICYEIIFPGSVVHNETNKPDVIMNVTNDAWYGKSAGPHQHFVHAQFRAIEEKTPVIRSANTGFSGIVDSYGRVLYKSNLFVAGTHQAFIPK